MKSGPYDEYRVNPLWEKVEAAIHDLIENKDLTLTTSEYYVVGYLTKKLLEGNKGQNKQAH